LAYLDEGGLTPFAGLPELLGMDKDKKGPNGGG
jgi:hypothetical protein